MKEFKPGEKVWVKAEVAAKKPGKEWAEKIMANPKYFPAYSVMLARAALSEE